MCLSSSLASFLPNFLWAEDGRHEWRGAHLGCSLKPPMPRTPGLHTKGELRQDRGVKGEASSTPPGSSNAAPGLTGFWGRVSRTVLKNVVVDMNGDLRHPGWWFWAPRSLIQHSTNSEMGNKEHKWKDHHWQPNYMLTDRWMNNVTAWVLASAGWAGPCWLCVLCVGVKWLVELEPLQHLSRLGSTGYKLKVRNRNYQRVTDVLFSALMHILHIISAHLHVRHVSSLE